MNDATAPDFSMENLQRLIATMSEWSRSHPYTPEQMAAWRLRWFGVTPEQDQAAREEYREHRAQRPFEDDVSRYDRREPFIDWPNGQGTYD